MDNCVLNTPKKFYFGVNAIEKLGEEAEEIVEYWQVSEKKVIIITDKGVEGAGLVNRASKPLERSDFTIEIYSEAKPEPDYESYDNVVEKVRRGKYSIVVGLGGGSPMDQAKLAAMLVTNPGTAEQYFEGKLKLKKRGIHVILIPTTAGTGSEITPTSVAIGKQGIKTTIHDRRFMYADLALVDPMMTVSLPPKQTASTGMDALSHTLFRFLGLNPINPLSESLIHQALSLIANNLRAAYINGENIEARSSMSMAASIGFMGSTASPGQTGGINHALGEVFGPLYNLPHGLACGLSAIYDLLFNLMGCPEKLIKIANIFGEPTDKLPLYQAAMKGVEAVRKLAEDVNIPTSLKDVGVSKNDLPRLAKLSYNRARPYVTKSPRKITEKSFAKLYEIMWKGDTSSYRL